MQHIKEPEEKQREDCLKEFKEEKNERLAIINKWHAPELDGEPALQSQHKPPSKVRYDHKCVNCLALSLFCIVFGCRKHACYHVCG